MVPSFQTLMRDQVLSLVSVANSRFSPGASSTGTWKMGIQDASAMVASSQVTVPWRRMVLLARLRYEAVAHGSPMFRNDDRNGGSPAAPMWWRSTPATVARMASRSSVVVMWVSGNSPPESETGDLPMPGVPVTSVRSVSDVAPAGPAGPGGPGGPPAMWTSMICGGPPCTEVVMR